MDRNEFAGKWKQVKGHARQKWGKLTDDDLDQIQGRREVLVGRIQERYGKTREEADEAVAEWFDDVEERVAG